MLKESSRRETNEEQACERTTSLFCLIVVFPSHMYGNPDNKQTFRFLLNTSFDSSVLTSILIVQNDFTNVSSVQEVTGDDAI